MIQGSYMCFHLSRFEVYRYPFKNSGVYVEFGILFVLLTPHVLSEWMVEVCRFEVRGY